MNPLEYVDYLEDVQIKKIQDAEKEEYSKEEVIALLKDMGKTYRKAIYNGEYILDVETLTESHVTVADKECSIQKLISDDKYLLFIQVSDITGNFTSSDIQIMGEEIQKAIKKTNNILGVVMLPPNIDVSVITAKLDNLSYAGTLKFTEEDLKILYDIKKNSSTYHNGYYKYDFDYRTGSSSKVTISNTTNPYW